MDSETNSNRPTIASLPGLYRGRYFRSKLECRWAFFFDELGIRYQFEPQAFELSDGRRYLPDFYLPQIAAYAEVKPDTEKLSKQLWAITEFIQAGMGEKILMLIDEPAFKPYTMVRPVRLDGGFVESSSTSAILDVFYKPKLLSEEHRLFEDVPDYQFEREEDFTLEYRDAVYMARAARFDNREQGVPGYIRERIMRAVRTKAFGDIA